MAEHTLTPIRMPLAELLLHIESFLEASAGKSKETRGTYQRALREFSVFFAREKHFLFRQEDVERYKQYLAEEKLLQDVSISTYLTALRRLCSYLVDCNILQANPALAIRGGRRPASHKRTFLSMDDIEMLFASIDTSTVSGKRDAAIIRMMLGCACSELEITRVDIGDLHRRGDAWMLYVQGKGRSVKDEAVPVPERTVAAIRDYLGERNDQSEAGDPMFVSNSNRSRGARMTIRGLREAVAGRLKDSGVKRGRDRKLTPFSLRHTAGILLAEAGVSPEELMRRMRIEWRPTAMIYFRQVGKIRSRERADKLGLMTIEYGTNTDL